MGPVPVICIRCKYRFSCPLRLVEMLKVKEDWNKLIRDGGHADFTYFKNEEIDLWVMPCLDKRTEPFLVHTCFNDNGREYVQYKIRFRQEFIRLYREIHKI